MSRFRGKRRFYDPRYLTVGLSLQELLDWIESIPDEPEAHHQNIMKMNDAVKDIIAYGEIAVDPLLERLFRTNNSWTQWAAFWALRDIGDPQAIEPLWKFYDANEHNKSLQIDALLTLSRLKDERVFPIVLSFLDVETLNSRLWMIYALENLADSRAIDILNSLLDHPDEQVRQTALRSLQNALAKSRIANMDSISALTKLLYQPRRDLSASGSDGHWRCRIIDVFAAINDETTRAILEAAIRHPQPAVRRRARKALQKLQAGSSPQQV